jgi:hypothetical protein
MDRDTVIAKLKHHEAELRGLGVGALYLFGSVAEGKERPDSDVDLFFDPTPDADFSLLELAGLQVRLTDALGVEADVHMREYLNKHIRRNAEAEAVQVF